MKPSKNTLSRMKEAVYRNAVRLFCDSCVMFKNRSYPSAYALAVLSFEELGKLEMIDHVCDDIQLGWDPTDMIKLLFSSHMFFSHKNKQAWAENDGWLFQGDTNRKKQIYAGDLDREKQDSFYVGYSRGRIRLPSRISAAKAFAELSRLKKKFDRVEDLGFNGFDCFSTADTRAKARRQRKRIEKHFASVRKPKRKTNKID